MANPDIKLGSLFPSLQSFREALSKYEKENNVLFVKTSTHLLGEYSPDSERLKYKKLILICKQGGQKAKSTSTGIRPNQRSFKVGCTAKIRLRACKQNGMLQLHLYACQLQHSNHPTTEESVKALPENRRVLKAERSTRIKAVNNAKKSMTSDTKRIIDSITYKYNTTKPNISIIDRIKKHLPSFSSGLVEEEYKLSESDQYTNQKQSNGSYFVTSYGDHSQGYTTSSQTCSCQFFTSYNLPCRHIFYIRYTLGMELYPLQELSKLYASGLTPEPTVYTKQQRYETCRELTKAIYSFLPVCEGTEFNYKVGLFQKLYCLLKEDKKVEILDMSGVGDTVTVNPTTTSSSTYTPGSGSTTTLYMQNVTPQTTVLPSENNFDGFESPHEAETEDITDVDFAPSDAAAAAAPVESSSTNPTNDGHVITILGSNHSSSSEGKLTFYSNDTSGLKNVRVKKVVTATPKKDQDYSQNRRSQKAKVVPVSFESKKLEEQMALMLAGCLQDLSQSQPFCVNALRSAVDMSSLCADNTVDMSVIRNCFTDQGWDELRRRIVQKDSENLIKCKSCYAIDQGEFKMVQCESCLEWFHFHCINLKDGLDSNTWFCTKCWSNG